MVEKEFSDKEWLYQKVPVPLPPCHPALPEDATVAEAIHRVNTCFDEAIGVYAPCVQERLKKMYYHDESVFFKDDVQERTDGPAVFHFPVNVASNATTGEVLSVDYSPSIEIDSAFKDSPLFVAFVKVHEIACHIGQCLSCMNKPDVMRYQNLVSSGDMLNFTELSASFLEKALVHAIPEKVWGQDLLGEPFVRLMLSNDPDKKHKQDLLFDYHRKMTGYVQSIPEEAYWHLEHRKDIRPDGSAHVIGGTTVTCDDVALLHSRADVRDYISRQKPRLPVSPTRQRPPSPSLGTSPQ